MRIYIMLRGNRTTVSVDDHLIAYLADRVCITPFDRSVGWRQTTRKWIQKSIDGAGNSLPEKNISQWIQSQIVDAIVDPILLSKRSEAAQCAAKMVRHAGADVPMKTSTVEVFQSTD